MYKDFIKEFIWIYPDWVESSEMGVNIKKGSRFTITLGVYTHMIDGEMQRGLCSCYVSEKVSNFSLIPYIETHSCTA